MVLVGDPVPEKALALASNSIDVFLDSPFGLVVLLRMANGEQVEVEMLEDELHHGAGTLAVVSATPVRFPEPDPLDGSSAVPVEFETGQAGETFVTCVETLR